MKRRWCLLIAILLVSLVLLYGCGKEENGGLTVQQLIDQGWTKFSAGNYAGAYGDFNAAKGLSADTNEAYLGLGWAELSQSHAGLAEHAFVTYLARATNSNDVNAKAGLALAYHAQQKFQEAINTANTVLSSAPNWSFPRDSRINHLDLALILAHSYYGIGNFSQSLAVVQQYFPEQPPFNPNLNTDEGRAQLGEKLQSLYTG